MSAPHDRPTKEPGGMECQECGVIFIGAEWHALCAVCVQKIADNIAREQRTKVATIAEKT